MCGGGFGEQVEEGVHEICEVVELLGEHLLCGLADDIYNYGNQLYIDVVTIGDIRVAPVDCLACLL